MSNLQFNNSSGQCVLQECSQFGASNASGFLTSNDSPISKLATDDYMSELDPDHQLISLSNHLSNSLSNNNRHFSAIKQLSAIQMDQQQQTPLRQSQTDDAPNTTSSHSNPHSVQSDPASNSQISQINQITDQNTSQITNQTNSPPTSQPNSETNWNNHSNNQRTKHNGSPPPQANDSDEELFEEADESSDESVPGGSNQAATVRPRKSECLDIETMRTHLVKLKLSKDLSSSPNSNLTDSPLTNELNEENDYAFFDAIDDYDDEEIERGPMIRSTSLKTGKAKSLGPKKTLRFADALGECSPRAGDKRS